MGEGGGRNARQGRRWWPSTSARATLPESGRQEGRQLAPELLEAARSVSKGVASGWILLPVGGSETGERFPQTMGSGRVAE